MIDRLDEILFERQKRNEKEIFVADITKCLRKAYYSILYPKPQRPQTVIGKMLHFSLEKMLENHIKALFEVSFVLRLNNGWLLKGRCDMMQDDEIYEFKFVRNIKRARENISYYLQLQLYLHAFKAKKGYLVFINRETLDFEAIEVILDACIAEKLIEDAEYLAKCLESKTAPEKQSPRYNKECEFCEYCDRCFSDYCDNCTFSAVS